MVNPLQFSEYSTVHLFSWLEVVWKCIVGDLVSSAVIA